MHGLGGLWEIGFIIGALVLASALVWGMTSSSRRNRANDTTTEAATRANYENTDTYGGKETDLRKETRL